MSKSIQLHIDDPCHENWNRMTPREQGRYCMSCQKTVVDFSLMSDKEILDYIARSGSNTCGRFTNDQLGRDIEEIKQPKRWSWAYVWNLVVATFLMTGTAKAQGTVAVHVKEQHIPKDTVPPVSIVLGTFMPAPEQRLDVISGMVLNEETGEPVRYASVMIKGTTKGTATDSSGKFAISNTGFHRKAVITVSAIGYEEKEYKVTRSNFKNITISLQPAVQELSTVVVVGYGVVGKLTMTTGAISIQRRDTIFDKAKRVIDDWKPKKDVRVYPNPVERGNIINVALSLKETGEYRLDLMDAGGKVVRVQTVRISNKEQTIAIATDAAWSAGTYWLRITGRHTKNVYNGKVLLR